jgi:imidazolonepropionase-like amidohydrolase
VHADATYSLLETEIKPMSHQQREAQMNLQKENLLLLKKFHVPVTVGCDSYNLTAQTEIEYLRKMNVYSNLELLKMWCEVTPAAIFPNRKIAKLQEGYEASFLVLAQNPLLNFEHAYTINFRVKQGVLLW